MNTRPPLVRPLALAACLLALVPLAAAQSVVNGAMNGTADFTTYNGVVPAGWTGVGFGGTDLWNSTTTAAGTAWSTSLGGGTFVHGVGLLNPAEWVEQDISGLTPGATYTITFEQALSATLLGSMDPAGGWWRIQFGAAVQDSPVMLPPAIGVPATWQFHSMTFTATAPTQTLRLTAMSVTAPNPTNWRSELGIDTVSLVPQCTVPPIAGFEFVRAGTPPNPLVLMPSTTGPPALGVVWDPWVDHTTFVPNAIADIYLFTALPANVPAPPAGTLLCQPPAFLNQIRTPPDSLHLYVPPLCILVDVRFCLQVVTVDPTITGYYTNALDVVIGN